jgi:hypothetical protein
VALVALGDRSRPDAFVIRGVFVLVAAATFGAFSVSTAAAAFRVVPGVRLEAVSCPSASSCWAVGAATGGAHKYHGVVVQLEHGATAGIQYLGSRTLLRGVSCSGAETCIAVGEGPEEQGEVVAITDGRAGPTQSVGTAGWSLGEVSCASSSVCWAVGDNGGTLVEIEEGKPVYQEVVPGIVTFDDIACEAASSCVATGARSLTIETLTPILGEEVGNETVIGPNLIAVGCAPGGPCELVGNTYPSKPLHALVAELHGTAAGPPKRVPGVVFLTGISCPASGVCEAIGNSSTTIHSRGAAVTIVDGTPQRTQLLAPGQNLNAVACGSAFACVAIGNADHGRHQIVTTLSTGA